jgi:hypothetical protein
VFGGTPWVELISGFGSTFEALEALERSAEASCSWSYRFSRLLQSSEAPASPLSPGSSSFLHQLDAPLRLLEYDAGLPVSDVHIFTQLELIR